MTGADIVAEARAWLGTPFRWQASLKGVGCDCKGLVWGVARELGLPEAGNLHAAISDYGARVPVALLQRGLADALTATDDPQPGDVLLMKVSGRPQHLGILSGDAVIHTYSGGPRKVIATSAKACLRVFPLVSAWRFGSLA